MEESQETFEEQDGDYTSDVSEEGNNSVESVHCVKCEPLKGESVNIYPVEELFSMYARFGDARGSGDVMCLKNFEKWIKQANIKPLQPIEAVMHFSKVAKGKKAISYKEFLEAVDRLAGHKQLSPESVKQKLVDCGPPQPTNPTKTASLGVYDRLTDRTKYTGVCKKKFDDLSRMRKSASGTPSRNSFCRKD